MDEIWAEKVRAYKESLKGARPDLDIALLFRILDIVNESSEVKVAVNPIKESGEWSSDAPTWSVSGVVSLDDGRVALRVNSERHGMEAGELFLRLKKAYKHRTVEKTPVLFVHGDKVLQLTDVYSHALVREMYAGMPFDVVLAIKLDEKPEEKKTEEKKAAE